MATTHVPAPGSVELTVLCRGHNRKCMMHAENGLPPRLRHMSSIGTPAEFCESALFVVRRESLESRETVLDEMTTTPVAGVRETR